MWRAIWIKDIFKAKASRKFVLLTLIAALVLTACQPARVIATPIIVTQAPEARHPVPGSGDVLRLLSPEIPTALNPHLSSAGKDQEVARIVYEPLASFDRDGNLVPFLAVEIPSVENGGVSADGKWVVWDLKPDVRWSDGEPFTGADVKFTFEYVTNPEIKAVTASSYSAVESVEVLELYKVRVNFKYPNPAWYVPFVGVRGAILPKHVFEKYKGAEALNAKENNLPKVGTGPYMAKEPGIKPQEVVLLGSQVIKTNKIVFEPNPYFREPDKPYFSQIELRGGGTSGLAADQLLTFGNIDIAFVRGQLPPEAAENLKTSTRGRLIINFGAVMERMLLNRTDPNQATSDGERSNLKYPHPFFSDLRVRQAFAYAVDREAIAALYGASGRPAIQNLVAPPQFVSTDTTSTYPYDLKKAAALLDEAGWIDTNHDRVREKDGKKLKVVYQTYVGDTAQATQQIIKQSLEKIGVQVELKIVDSTFMFGAGNKYPDSEYRFNADMQAFSIGSPSPDPAAYMVRWTCAQIPQKANDWTAGLNVERWCNPEYDALYQKAVAELDPEKRQQLFIQLNDMLIDDVVMIPLVVVSYAQVIASQSIEGVDLTPWDTSTWNIKDWRRSAP